MKAHKEFLEQIKNEVLSYDDKAEVILFGSRARRDYKEDSDWDLLILTSEKLDNVTRDALRDRIYYIELEYTHAVSIIIIDKGTWSDWEIMPLYKNVAREGIPI